ncbi:MAG: hypothetical protein WC807_04735 [Hyphomicrobium sp.]|jgi:ribosomal protein L12E/L44/L45/RPP1/RPP2
MAKNLGKSEKLDLLLSEVVKINKQLKVLSLQQATLAEALAKLKRSSAAVAKPAPSKPAPVKAAAPAGKPAATRKAEPKSSNSARPVLVASPDPVTPPKIAS